jgi:hypothetical protein
MQFEMNRTWSEAVGLVRANFQLLALIAGLFMLLPSLVIVVTMPQLMTLPTPASENPEQMAQQLMAVLPGLFGAIVVLMLIAMVGYSAMAALIGPDRPTVGGAIGKAIKVLPTMIGVFLVFLVAYLIGAIVLGLVAGLLAAAIGLVTGSASASFLMTLLMFVLIGYVVSRFSVLLPIVVIDGVRNPIAAYARSWRLTASDHWRIFGFWALLMVAYVVILLLFVSVSGALGAIAGSGVSLVFGIVGGLLGMVIAMLVTSIVVSMHGQLAGTSSRTITETFE